MSRFTAGIALAAIGMLGVGCGLIASREASTGSVPTERVSGDPPVSAGFEVQPEGTTPPDVAVTALDVSVRSDLPVPATTQCDGLWVDVHLRSGRVLRYPPCALPPEIAELRDSALRAGPGSAATFVPDSTPTVTHSTPVGYTWGPSGLVPSLVGQRVEDLPTDVPWRVTQQDGQPLTITDELVCGRHDLTAESGIVVAETIEGAQDEACANLPAVMPTRSAARIRVSVQPRTGGTHTVVVLSFEPTVAAGVVGDTRYAYRARVRSAPADACVQDLDMRFGDEIRVGSTVSVRLDPDTSPGRHWCKGTFHGTVFFTGGFACPDHGTCQPPAGRDSESLVVGRFSFKIR